MIHVSHHAIRRWLERVEGVDVASLVPAGTSDRAAVTAACNHYGFDESAIRSRIASPVVQQAISLKASRMLHRGVGYAFSAEGTVVSIVCGRFHGHCADEVRA
jgi:hypothetical protein